MRLSKIKLAGFKSFVDPTTVVLPTNLTGVVGPNGCGKSNIIDAVRWVMGESSAKNLRGDSMADVIFNGSNTRKPVGQASIELVFDNSDGTLGGQYATYNEISVKRVVTRDGQSSYYLNSTRCRRRDITDIFLGTGLGPRSYAIIEQGTISRLIEARPEELRIFLEEAAGISKYKERRRETENRIRHTKDNLERLNDLRDELDKQLSHLQRQARTAERFKELKQEERLLKAQLQSLRWQELDRDAHRKEGDIRERETALEAEIAHQRSAEAEIEARREAHVDATESFNTIQSEYYGIGADIARLEQTIQHARERHQQASNDLAQLERAWNEAQAHQEGDRRRIEQLGQVLAQEEPALAAAEEAAALSAAAFAEAEEAMAAWQQQWDEFNQRATEPSQVAQVERSRIQQFEQQAGQLQQRISRLEEERGNLATAGLEEEIAEAQQVLAEREAVGDDLKEQLAAAIEQINTQREGNLESGRRLDEVRTALQAKRGRHASVEALQQAALGKGKGAVTDWLAGQQLSESRRLAETVSVDPHWERALECVLGNYLEAICVDGIDALAGALGSLEHGTVTLFEAHKAVTGADAGGDSLLAKTRGGEALAPFLAGIVVAETLEEALARRANLAPGQSVITADGVWVGPNWLRVSREADAHSGVFHREQELKDLEQAIAELQEQEAELRERQQGGAERLRGLEQEREAIQRQIDEATRHQGELRAQLGARQARLEQLQGRHERLNQDHEELRAQAMSLEEETAIARQRLHESLETMETLAIEREELSGRRDTLREGLEQARQQMRMDSERVHQHNVRIQTVRTELGSTEQALTRAEQQLEQLAQRREELGAMLADGDAPIREKTEELDEYLNRRMAVEERLGEARRRVEDIDHDLRRLEGERTNAERKAQGIRSELDQVRMGWQEVKVRRQTLQEQVAEANFRVEAVLEALPEGANINDWQRQLDDVGQKIQRLGPINLAAIEEFESQSERKNYLDAQNADLMEALETLENAIRKIDRETRTRFKETFDLVNTGLQAKFPRLFGGGHAYLELTGEDLLDTGVAVMARPPGKRNSTIHLLSGGEKALTAVALVFAIFELNPSPFCMLDEVDAPLDEANVGRFCNLVKEMSEQVQFIFITHNKATMELSQTLTGVTMHEPGVSRLVMVDVAEAMELAAV